MLLYQEHGKMHDGVMMKDGKMMDKDMTMSNGNIVIIDETVIMKDGKTIMIKDVRMMSIGGKMKTIKMGKMKDKM